MICQGYRYAAVWEGAFCAGDSKIAKNFFLQITGVINWVLGVTGFIGFLVGLAMLAYVSVETVTVSPNPSLQEGRQADGPELERQALTSVTRIRRESYETD